MDTEFTKVLYNDACGDWSFDDEFFSDEFLEKYKEKYVEKLNICMHYDTYRYNPKVIALYEELGKKISSHENASIKICNFPTKWLNCMDVKIFEGRENIVFSKDKAYKCLLKEIITSKIVTDDNIEKYNEIENFYNKWSL